MTANQTQILELFRALAPDEREALLPQLAEAVESEVGFEELSAEEIAAIEEGLAQAERGEIVDADEALNRIAERLNLARA